MSGLDKVIGDAKKILGKDAKIPTKHAAGIDKAYAELEKQIKLWKPAKETLEKALADLQNATSKYRNAISQAEDEIMDGDYGLNLKDAADKKKIDQVQKMFGAWFKEYEGGADDAMAALKELDKHMMHVSNYKSPTIS